MGFKSDGILVITGLEEVGLGHTLPVPAIETRGAASLHASLLASYADHSAPIRRGVMSVVVDVRVVDRIESFAGSSSYLLAFIAKIV
ncbi:hypothetical protein BT69DRAFT_1291386 [Atractiella rhizophila]|nr:hypothetical protein BT69DRAFT_1291386 [Atractiella rhizophila]